MAKNCEKCKSGLDCDVKNELAKKAQQVDYIVHEGIMWRMERVNKRFLAIILVLVALLAASLIGFFVYESQFEDVVITADQQADTGNNYAVGGDMIGEAKGNNQDTTTQDGR